MLLFILFFIGLNGTQTLENNDLETLLVSNMLQFCDSTLLSQIKQVNHQCQKSTIRLYTETDLPLFREHLEEILRSMEVGNRAPRGRRKFNFILNSEESTIEIYTHQDGQSLILMTIPTSKEFAQNVRYVNGIILEIDFTRILNNVSVAPSQTGWPRRWLYCFERRGDKIILFEESRGRKKLIEKELDKLEIMFLPSKGQFRIWDMTFCEGIEIILPNETGEPFFVEEEETEELDEQNEEFAEMSNPWENGEDLREEEVDEEVEELEEQNEELGENEEEEEEGEYWEEGEEEEYWEEEEEEEEEEEKVDEQEETELPLLLKYRVF